MISLWWWRVCCLSKNIVLVHLDSSEAIFSKRVISIPPRELSQFIYWCSEGIISGGTIRKDIYFNSFNAVPQVPLEVRDSIHLLLGWCILMFWYLICVLYGSRNASYCIFLVHEIYCMKEVSSYIWGDHFQAPFYTVYLLNQEDRIKYITGGYQVQYKW